MKSLDFALLLSKYLTQYLPAQRNTNLKRIYIIYKRRLYIIAYNS